MSLQTVTGVVVAMGLCASATIAEGDGSIWHYSETADPFTDQVIKSVIALSPTHRSSRGETIAIFVTCGPDSIITASMIWEDVLQSQDGYYWLNYRIDDNPPWSALSQIVGSGRDHIRMALQPNVESLVNSMLAAESRNTDAELLTGTETVRTGRRLARFPLAGFTEAVTPILNECHF